MKKVLKILLFVSFITIIGCNGGGGGSSNEPLTVEITGWYTENIDTSFWSKTGKTYDETAYFSMKIEANAPDGIKDITYVEVSQERGSYWILRDNISGIDFYDSAEGAFIIRRCYNQNSPHLIWLSNYTAFAEDSAGNTATHTIDLSSPGALSSKDAIVASENYSGDNRGPDMIKRASSILAFKGTSDLTIIFQVEDDRVYNGNVWFYNESAEYITESGYFKNTINDGFELFTDGSSNMLKIKASDLDLGSYAWDDIQGFHIVLMDGAQYIPKEYWDHRSISQYISSLKSDKSIIQLGYKVIDVEYSKQMDRIIMISDNPAQLHIFYPIDEENTSVDLPLTPTCVSVSPDGLYAVVGHDYLFSYINLTTAVLEKTIAVSTSVHDIVLAENGYAYVFPNDGGWNIPSINIVTEIETQSTNRIGIHERTTARLHPDGEAIYGIPGGIMSPDLQKYSIINGTAEISGGSPYHIEYKPGGDLWISEDGLRIFTGSGNIFHSSNDRADDMFYYGSLSEQDSIEHMSDSTLANKVIAIPTDHWTNMGDTQIQIYAYDSLVFEKSIELPNFFLGNNAYPWHGKFVFISSDGSKYFVVIQADESSGIIDDFGVAIYDLE